MEGEQLALFDVKAHAKEVRRIRADVFNDYDGFVDKFKVPKTTDDCYTPQRVYDEVVDFVGTLTDLTDRKIVRPFVPGGDFERYAYPDNCIVIDNPPFSIYAKIVRFYLEQDIDFFLFAPALTQFVKGADVCYCITMADVLYANGADVRTSFTTNLVKDTRVWVCGQLNKRLTNIYKEMCKDGKRENAIFEYPNNIVTCALMGKVASRGVEFKVAADDCMYIVGDLDCLKAEGKGLFGGGIILSERAAAERAAAERAAAERAAAERRRRNVLHLSEREKIIYKKILNK